MVACGRALDFVSDEIGLAEITSLGKFFEKKEEPVHGRLRPQRSGHFVNRSVEKLHRNSRYQRLVPNSERKDHDE